MCILDFDLDPEWHFVKVYDIRKPVPAGVGLGVYSHEQILEAKRLVIEELDKENIEQYKPSLCLIVEDEARSSKNKMVIHAIVEDEENKYDGEDSRGRTFHLQNGVIVKIEKGRLKAKDADKFITY